MANSPPNVRVPCPDVSRHSNVMRATNYLDMCCSETLIVAQNFFAAMNILLPNGNNCHHSPRASYSAVYDWEKQLVAVFRSMSSFVIVAVIYCTVNCCHDPWLAVDAVSPSIVTDITFAGTSTTNGAAAFAASDNTATSTYKYAASILPGYSFLM